MPTDLSDTWKQAVENLLSAADRDREELLHAVAARIHQVVDREIEAATASPPAVPTGLTASRIEVLSPDRALVWIAWLPVPGATIYQYGHVGPDGEWHRMIGTTTATQAEIGDDLPFVVSPGGPYTVYVQAGSQYGTHELWSDPAVLEIHVPAYVAPEPKSSAAVAEVTGQILNDALVVPLLMGAPGGALQTVQCVVDTGAFECAIDATTASQLGLPNLGATTVGGVGGSASAYLTQVDVQFGPGGTKYEKVNAVAIEGFGQNLWGLRFAVDRQYRLCLDTKAATLAYYEGA